MWDIPTYLAASLNNKNYTIELYDTTYSYVLVFW